MGSTPLSWLHISEEVEEHLPSASLTLKPPGRLRRCQKHSAQRYPRILLRLLQTAPRCSPPPQGTAFAATQLLSPRGGTEPFLLAPSPLPSSLPAHTRLRSTLGNQPGVAAKQKSSRLKAAALITPASHSRSPLSCKSVCSIKYAQLTRMKPLAAFIDVHYLGFYSIINNRGEADTRPLISLRCAAHPQWCAENISPGTAQLRNPASNVSKPQAGCAPAQGGQDHVSFPVQRSLINRHHQPVRKASLQVVCYLWHQTATGR